MMEGLYRISEMLHMTARADLLRANMKATYRRQIHVVQDFPLLLRLRMLTLWATEEVILEGAAR